MASTLHWKTADLEALPYVEGTRYEIIGGELFVSTAPHSNHQFVCGEIYRLLQNWSLQTKLGKTILGTGLIFADDDAVIPDVAWLSNESLTQSLGKDGKLHSPPDLVIEVLSPGAENRRRDRDAKLKLYSRRCVLEYWIVDWQVHKVEVHRQQNGQLTLIATLVKADLLASSLLPGFSTQVDDLFEQIPKSEKL